MTGLVARIALAALVAATLLSPSGPDSVRAQSTPSADGLVYGVIVDTTNPNSMRLAREGGFSHVKMILYWPRLEPAPGALRWLETSENDLDNVLKAAGAEGLPLILRVDEVPAWAGGSPAGADLGAVEAFYAAMAGHGRGRVVGYEILNEPNLPFEWGGPPSAAGYAAFLKAAYRGIKAGDPSALVIGGGPSPNTGGFGGTVEDVDFLRGMYAAGARGSFDALGVHNYGGNTEPERDPADCGICFRRAELYRRIMVEQGDAATPAWATEFGWLLDPGRYLGQYDWMKVSAERQAEYVVRSYRYAAANWPWMRGMLLSNLDASTSPYHTGPEDGLPWFAILNPDHSPRPAYEAFKQMRGEMDEARRRAQATPVATPAAATAPEPAPQAEPAGEPAASASAAPEPAAVDRSNVVRVAGTSGQGASLRAEPSTRAARLAVLREGTRLEVVGPDRQAEGRAWRNVRSADGVSGWVAAELVRPDG